MVDKWSSASSGFFNYSVYGFIPRTRGGPLLAFAGEVNDRMTECYMLGRGHRAYSSLLMRFYSSDGLSPFGYGGINSYVYCQGDPINNLDPSGQMKVRHTVKRSNPLRQLLNRELNGGSVSAPSDNLRPMAVSAFVNGKEKTLRPDIYLRVTDTAIALLDNPGIVNSRAGVLQKDAQFIQFNVVVNIGSPERLGNGIGLAREVFEHRKSFLIGGGELHQQDPEFNNLSELRDVVRSKGKVKPRE